MKKSNISLFVVIILLVILQTSYASYYAWQNITVKIISINEPVTYDSTRERFTVKAAFQVIKLGEGGGHSSNHGMQFLGKTREGSILFRLEIEAKKLASGMELELKYSYSEGLGFDRETQRQKVYRGERWDFIRFL